MESRDQGEGLLKVGDQIGGGLDAHRQADHLVAGPGGLALVVGKLAMGGGWWGGGSASGYRRHWRDG
ncbi:hypothetical protein Rru_A2077 [Rhodospirillum rubrum ATCC 11170]|uniref:Uncharacterized protein n=1 Tax=Rhodospirillum rubrum (strain ATCC 11170 / ATH 1.1.1 / DSM 467 / LMG 4362 / NCIMB 8255 / S1) TaxID=269796 RepID=Q2RSL8_RHORT|nr:hypothetical protein Rru_A2077 [Rhodospirillum rubrum ATCC 11170]